jgi:hypothetical protein
MNLIQCKFSNQQNKIKQNKPHQFIMKTEEHEGK